jgi:alkyl hydroperoxide reductase subunit AhpC
MLRLSAKLFSTTSLPVRQAARVTKPAPLFAADAVISGQFEHVTLQDYLNKKQWLYLMFYPLDFTFVCPTELTAFSDRHNDFKALNCAVIAASVDSKFSHLAFTKQARTDGGLGEMKIPLLADITKSIARDYGVLLEDEGVALRGSFLIDPQGILRQATINDLPVGRSVDEAVRLLKAFQFADKHGEVCPANWQEGAQSMKADVELSKEYFNKLKK